MAVGFPTKANWAAGEVLTAAQMDDLAGTVNTLNPTAKGGIITASAANTPAILSVGSDYGFLQSLASATNGIQWNSGAWTQVTFTPTASSGTFTSVNGYGKYIRIGKLCVFQFGVSTTTNGTAAGAVRVPLPFAAMTTGSPLYAQGVVRDYFVTGVAGFCYLDPSNTYLSYNKYDNTYLGGNGYYVGGTICYEVA